MASGTRDEPESAPAPHVLSDTTDVRPRAFVVMPYGVTAVERVERDGSRTTGEVDFDAVYAQLLEPALLQAGCEPVRADREPGSGDIRTDLFFELVTAELVVVDVSVWSPNVFYELGVRHGVAERGVLLLHGGFQARPFDVAPDRTLPYDGDVFLGGRAVPPPALARAVEQLAARLAAARAVDAEKIGSPVYKELTGLRPPDRSHITGGRARYFGTEFLDWRGRIRAAQAAGRPGDILTLARDAPNRQYARELSLAAAHSLVVLGRYDLAHDVLEELVAAQPDDPSALCELGQVLGRLGRPEQAEARLRAAVRVTGGGPESQGMLGRLAKDQWRLSWEHLPELTQRRREAGRRSPVAERAVTAYGGALRSDLASYYSALNLLSLTVLLEDLGAAAPASALGGPEELATLVRVSVRSAQARLADEGDDVAGAERAWCEATLGELSVLAGDERGALRCYRRAAEHARDSRFHLDSMLSQLAIYQGLGFHADVAGVVAEELEASRVGALRAERHFRRVVAGGGHLLDAPQRPRPRFPRDKEQPVRAAVLSALQRWEVGDGDLVLTCGAGGADLLIAEAALELGASVRLLLAQPVAQVVQESVDPLWHDRFFALLDRCEVREQTEELGRPPARVDVYARANAWCLSTALVEATPGRPFALAVWDAAQAADGPGGTAHFVQEARRVGARLHVVDPRAL